MQCLDDIRWMLFQMCWGIFKQLLFRLWRNISSMCCFLTWLKLVLYSGNLSREKTSANFELLLLCTKVFFAKLASFGDNISEQTASFPHKNPISTDSWKFSLLKVFRYTVVISNKLKQSNSTWKKYFPLKSFHWYGISYSSWDD